MFDLGKKKLLKSLMVYVVLKLYLLKENGAFPETEIIIRSVQSEPQT